MPFRMESGQNTRLPSCVCAVRSILCFVVSGLKAGKCSVTHMNKHEKGHTAHKRPKHHKLL